MFVAGSTTDVEETGDDAGIENGGLELEEINNRQLPPMRNLPEYRDLPLSRLRDAPPPSYPRDAIRYSDVRREQERYVVC